MVKLLNFQVKIFIVQNYQHTYQILGNIGVNLQNDDFYLSSNGKLINSQEQFNSLNQYSTIICSFKLKGGKGGFGAKLKTQGGKKVRPNDNMFSRDVSGRRVAYAMVEKQYTQYCKKKNIQNQKIRKQRQQFNVFQSTLKQGQSFMKLDKKYNQELEDCQKTLQSSFKIGLQKIRKKKQTVSNDKQEDNKQYLPLNFKNESFSQKQQNEKQDKKDQQYQQKYQQKQKEEQKPIVILQQGKRMRPQQLQIVEKIKQDINENLRNESSKVIKTQTLSIQSDARNKLKSLFKK